MHIQVVSPMWPSEDSRQTGVFVKNLSEALERHGFTVENSAVLLGKGRGRTGRLTKHARLGVDILRQVLRPADCVYVHAPSWFSPLIDIGRLPRKKSLVVHTHGGEVYPHSRMERWSQPAVAHLLARADLVVAPSEYYAREVERTFDVPRERLFVSPSGGVDLVRFSPRDRTDARRRYGLHQNSLVIGFAGRIENDKGWDTYLDTLAILIREGRDVRGIVVGDGTSAAALNRRVKELGLSDRVICAGEMHQADLAYAHASMDVFLFPTRRGAEALGLVPIEALATGVPVVGTDAYAVPEYVIDGETGFLASERDAESFASGVRRIADLSDAERRKMSESATRMARRYDVARSTEALATRIEEITS